MMTILQALGLSFYVLPNAATMNKKLIISYWVVSLILKTFQYTNETFQHTGIVYCNLTNNLLACRITHTLKSPNVQCGHSCQALTTAQTASLFHCCAICHTAYVFQHHSTLLLQVEAFWTVLLMKNYKITVLYVVYNKLLSCHFLPASGSFGFLSGCTSKTLALYSASICSV